ncbi:O-antigen ligase family protein [Klebsiella sp. I138]|uniref:O-antigen ligase family protein n=1 Tax=Klebsiella sp. I138 TaxID=2755385 RepID=UPI003DA90568
MRTLSKAVILLSLIFSVTNYVPVSVMVLLLTPLAIVGIFYRSDFLKFKKIELYLLLLYSYVIVSAIVYNSDSFLEFDFYRKDGNFLISYLILLVFIFFPLNIDIDIDKWLKRSFIIFSIASCIAFLIMPKEVPEEGGATVHHFFFLSHNAAGGFYSVIGAMALGMFIHNKNKLYLFYALLFVFFLYMTNSRGSILAIIAAFGYSLIKFKKPIFIFVLFLAIQFFIVYETYPTWVAMGKLMSENANYTVSNVAAGMNFQRVGTFIDRLYYLWPRALDNFIHSPIVGLGFGSYDDLYYRYSDVIPHLFSVKDGAFIRHSEAHAHNSTFTILAELGLVGYSLFVLLFNEINKKIISLKDKEPGIFMALSLAFWTCVFSSATEHRITTPSQMIPFFILFGICYLKFFGRGKKYD